MALTIRISETLRCPRRHRYNPERDGESFHAACVHCEAIYRAWLAAAILEARIERVKCERERWDEAKVSL